MKKIICENPLRVRLLIGLSGILIAISLLFPVNIFSSEQGFYRVFFKDKGKGEFANNSTMYNLALNQLSERTVKRRIKHNGENNFISFEDVPVCSVYVDSIKKLVVQVYLELKWQNYIVVVCDSLAAEHLKTLDFVKGVFPTSSTKAKMETKIDIFTQNDGLPSYFKIDESSCGKFVYGESMLQDSLLNVPIVHSYGNLGQGAVIGYLDVGYRWRHHEALVNSDVLGEWGFYQSGFLNRA